MSHDEGRTTHCSYSTSTDSSPRFAGKTGEKRVALRALIANSYHSISR